MIFVWIYISSAHFTAPLTSLSLPLCCGTMHFVPGSFRDILSLDLKVAQITRSLTMHQIRLRERSAKIILRDTDTVRLWYLFSRYKEERSPQAPRRSSLPARLVCARASAFSRRRRCRVVRHGRLVPEHLPQTRVETLNLCDFRCIYSHFAQNGRPSWPFANGNLPQESC